MGTPNKSNDSEHVDFVMNGPSALSPEEISATDWCCILDKGAQLLKPYFKYLEGYSSLVGLCQTTLSLTLNVNKVTNPERVKFWQLDPGLRCWPVICLVDGPDTVTPDLHKCENLSLSIKGEWIMWRALYRRSENSLIAEHSTFSKVGRRELEEIIEPHRDKMGEALANLKKIVADTVKKKEERLDDLRILDGKLAPMCERVSAL